MLRNKTIRRMGLPDAFVEHGKPKELRKLLGLDAESIYTVMREMAGA